VAVYDYECRTQNDEGQDITDRMQLAVQVGRTVVKSMPRSAYKEMDMDEEKDIMAVHQEAYMHMPTVWTDYPEGQTTVRDWIFPHEFEGCEPTPEIAWTLTDDTLTVGGYLCQTATCKFRGVEWHVCYTEEIPSSAGPWRLRGLPGLIVKAKSEAHTFCLAEIRQEIVPITYERKPDVQRVSYAKLLKHRNEVYGHKQYAKNPAYYIPDLGGSISHMEVYKNDGQPFIFANGYPLLTKAHVYQPLEQ
jgi:GLPGLI family protein